MKHLLSRTIRDKRLYSEFTVPISFDVPVSSENRSSQIWLSDLLLFSVVFKFPFLSRTGNVKYT